MELRHMKNKLNPTMSHNACYACTHVAVPLVLNNLCHHLGFTSKAHGDVTCVGYTLYEYKGFFWYSVTLDDGLVMNSLFFVSLSKCVRDFLFLCQTMCWELDDSRGLFSFVKMFNKSNYERGR